MKLLLVEDGLSKLQSAKIALNGWDIDVASSVNTAKMMMRRQQYKAMVIDMNLPTFDMDSGESGRIQHDGGLRLIQYAKIHQANAKCILFTQYDSLDVDEVTIYLDDITKQLKEKYPENFLGSVLYKSESDRWTVEMARLLEEI